MLQKLTFPLLLVCSVLMTACYTDLPLPPGNTKQKLVLQGELRAGDTLAELRIGQTLPLLTGGGGQLNPPQNVSVTVRESPGGAALSAICAEDAFSATHHTLVGRLPLRLLAGKRYQLQAAAPGLDTASAELLIPQLHAATITDTFRSGGAEPSVFNVRMMLPAAGPGLVYYAIEALVYDSTYIPGTTPGYSRIELSTADPDVLTIAPSGSAMPYLLLKNTSFGGAAKELSMAMPLSAVRTVYPGDVRRLTIRIKSIGEDYFNFLQQSESIPVFKIGTFFPVNVPGNVSNGFGMVAGAAPVEYRYVVP